MSGRNSIVTQPWKLVTFDEVGLLDDEELASLPELAWRQVSLRYVNGGLIECRSWHFGPTPPAER